MVHIYRARYYSAIYFCQGRPICFARLRLHVAFAVSLCKVYGCELCCRSTGKLSMWMVHHCGYWKWLLSCVTMP